MTLQQQYGGKIRVRVCGICIQNDTILLLKHEGIGESGFKWIPPGGGVEFGETMQEALKREFLEETNLTIEVGQLVAINEFIDEPLHAIEFFFLVNTSNFDAILGHDPETQTQILTDLQWLSYEQIQALPKKEIHQIFQYYKSINDIRLNFPKFIASELNHHPD